MYTVCEHNGNNSARLEVAEINAAGTNLHSFYGVFHKGEDIAVAGRGNP
jgi:hypothetical protein